MASLLRFFMGSKAGGRGPVGILRRKVISEVRAGNRKWIYFGGAVLVLRELRELFGQGTPSTVHTQQLDAGERFIILHSPAPPNKARRARRRA